MPVGDERAMVDESDTDDDFLFLGEDYSVVDDELALTGEGGLSRSCW